MPYQADVNPSGPQNICYGRIKLNKVQVHEGWAQYNTETVEDWFTEHDLEPITDIVISKDDHN